MSRRRRLTPEAAADLRAWYRSARTIAEKARELKISTSTLKVYCAEAHKGRAA